MAYMNQERKAKIVAAVKPILAKYGVKGTFKCDRLAITLRMASGKIDFIADQPDSSVQYGQWVTNDKDAKRKQYSFDVNPYWYQEHYTGISKQFLDELIPAMKAADYYDRSDAMTDYFDTAYYYHVKVGSWDKPYNLTK